MNLKTADVMQQMSRISIFSLILLVIGCLETAYPVHHLDDGNYVLRYSGTKAESEVVFSVEEVVHGSAADRYVEVSSEVVQIPDETPFVFATVQSYELVGKMTFPVFDIVSDSYEFLADWIEEKGIVFYADHLAMERVWVPISCRDDHERCQRELNIIGEAYRKPQQNRNISETD